MARQPNSNCSNCGKQKKCTHKNKTDDIQIQPLYNMQELTYLVEQLNGLIDRYEHIYTIKSKIMRLEGEDIESLNNVLSNIEQAINAIIDTIIKPKTIIKTQGIVPIEYR